MGKEKHSGRSNFGARGWAMVIYCFLVFFIVTGGVDSMNVSVYAFEEMYGWSQTTLLSLSSMGGYISVIFMYLAGVLYATKKVRLKWVILTSGIIYAITIALWALIPSLPGFIINYVICAVAMYVWGYFANNTLCANWFPTKKGLVAGWTTMGIPLGAGLCTALFNFLFSTFGMTASYIALGVISLALTLWGVLGFTEYPEQCGHFPDNDKNMTTEIAAAQFKEMQALSEKSPWTQGRLLTTWQVWVLSIALGFGLLFAGGTMAQMIPWLVASSGFEINQAVTVMMCAAFFACGGSYLCGFLDAKLGVKKAVIITYIIAIIACILGLFKQNMVTAIIMAAVIGMVLGGSSNYVMSATMTYWGRASFAKAYTPLLNINTLVGSLGAALVAIIAGSASYQMAFGIMGILAIICIILMLLIKPGFVEKKEAKWAAEGK